MAEIKLNEGFSSEVEAFRASGEKLSASASSIPTGELSLPTVDAYQDRFHSIWQIMIKFWALTKKDAADMDALAEKLKAADMAGSGG